MEHASKETTQEFTSRAEEATKGIKDKVQELAASAAIKAGEATTRMGEQIKTLGNKARPDGPRENGAAGSVAQTLKSASSYLQEKPMGEMIEDLTTLIRRHPVQSLLISVGIGYLLARATERA